MLMMKEVGIYIGRLRTTPLVELTNDMFFRTQHTRYVLMGPGRKNTIPLSTVLRMFSSERDGY